MWKMTKKLVVYFSQSINIPEINICSHNEHFNIFWSNYNVYKVKFKTFVMIENEKDYHITNWDQ